MQTQHFEAPTTDEDKDFTPLTGFCPIMLHDNRVDPVNESLTLSRSGKDQQLPHFSTLSSTELDQIDAECVSLQSQQMTATPHILESSSAVTSQREFAEDDAFFNYRVMGSLRRGLAPIALLSRRHGGLVITAVASGAALVFMHNAYRPLLFTMLNEKFGRKHDTNSTLLDFADMLSLFLGLFSDCVPIYGARRKTYIALGWIFTTVSYTSVGVIYLRQIRIVTEPEAIYGYVVEAWSIIGSCALQLSWVAALALIVGLGQRESLIERGGLATLFLVLWHVGALAGHITIARLQPSLTISSVSAIIVVVSIAALSFVPCFLHDDDEVSATNVASAKRVGVVPALRTGIIQLWEICQEKVTYRVLLFLLIYEVLLRARDPDVYIALTMWCGFKPQSDGIYVNNPWILLLESSVTIGALLHAKWRLLNTAWKPMASMSTGVVVVVSLVQTVVIATDTCRTKWFFMLFMGFIVWAKTWILFLALLSITEVAHVGCEGVTIGLVLSFRGLGTSALNALVEWTDHSTTSHMINQDSYTTRARIMKTAAVWAVVNLSSAVAVAYLPRSKLEVQQLRAFGGYNRRGGGCIVMIFALLLAFTILAKLDLL